MAAATGVSPAAEGGPTPAVAGERERQALRSGARLGFLDVLRGIAALAVALYHLGNYPPVGGEVFYWISHSGLNLGLFGVTLFFLVSGFIIPASLERHGSISEFWVSRFFRLFPLFWAVTLGVLGLGLIGAMDLPGTLATNPDGAFIGNLTILARHIGAPFLIGPAWTLPYELCFYLITTVLFVTRLRRMSVAVALLACGVALVASDQLVGRAALTPWTLGIPGYGGHATRVYGLAIVIGALAVILSRSPKSALYAGAISLLVVPILLNRPDPLHQAVIYLTTMLTGTVVHRIWAGQVSPRLGWAVVATGAGASCASFWIYSEAWIGAFGQIGESPLTRSIAVLVAYALFTVFLALRDRVRWPAPLTWLGRVSYSLYLVHWVVMMSVPPLPEWVPGRRILTFLMWLVVTLVVCELTYRLVEKPAIDLGRKVSRRMRARRGVKADKPPPAPMPDTPAPDSPAAKALAESPEPDPAGPDPAAPDPAGPEPPGAGRAGPAAKAEEPAAAKDA